MVNSEIIQRKRIPNEDGFKIRAVCFEYIRRRKELWGSNLVGWVEEKDGKFFPCFNVWD